jgi:hypothetical protein
MNPNEETVTLRVPFDGGLTWTLTGMATDQSVVRMVRELGGHYEPEVMNAMASVLPRDGVCFDIGANIGATSLPMSALVPEGCVHAFEPVPGNYAFLDTNLRRNGVRNCKAIHRGLFSKPTTLTFHYIEEFAGGGVHDDAGCFGPSGETFGRPMHYA